MSIKTIPLEFDSEFYRRSYVDLRDRNVPLLMQHYEAYGRREGRAASPACRRKEFLNLVPSKGPVLEIGPFYSPCVKGANVSYFDVLDQNALRARAKAIGYPTGAIPHIDYLDPNGDLSVINAKFSAVVSSHCIEHQPDLVHHLQEVARLLEPGGRYFLLIPNKFYCFDHMIPESTIANVLDAHRAKHRVHRLASVIEHRALTTHNDPGRHWNGDHADPLYWSTIAARTQAAIAEYDSANGAYIDVHAWQFTPVSFRQISQYLFELGLTVLQPERVYDTPHGSNEFTAVLRKA